MRARKELKEMKVKVSEKQLKNNYSNIISIGYCNAYYLLIGVTPDYYTCGIYGWSSDCYHINNNTLISTGYRPIGKISNSELVKKYNTQAEYIYNNNQLLYNVKIEAINLLLEDFIKDILEEVGE